MGRPLHALNRRDRRRGRRGAAAVEFALVVPLLLLIVLGIVDFGFMLSDRQAVSQAAAEGARAAAVSQGDPVADGKAAMQAALKTQFGNGFSCGSGCTVTLSADGCCATAKVSIPFDEAVPLPFFGGVVFPDKLTYQATARVS